MKTYPIVIIGGGFAGVRAALDLNKRYGGDVSTPIYLIDPSPYHVYTPGLYELTSSQTPRATAVPFTDIFEHTHVHYIQEKVVSVDTDAKQVVTEHRRIPYEDLVLAFGSQKKTLYGKAVETDETFTYKTIEDVLAIRRHITDCFQSVRDMGKHDGTYCHTHFVIAGAGPAGVEFSAGLQSFINDEAHRCNVSSKGVQISLVEASDRILGKVDPLAAKKVAKYLKKLGVLITTKTKMLYEGGNKLRVNKELLPLKTIFWTVGVEPNHVIKKIKGLQFDDHGHVLVDGGLQAIGLPRVWVGGDLASVADAGLAWTAQAHGAQIARAIRATRDQALAPAYKMTSAAMVLPLSNTYGVACFGKTIVEGILVIWYKRFIDLRYWLSILPPRLAWGTWLTRGQVIDEGGKLAYKPSR